MPVPGGDHSEVLETVLGPSKQRVPLPIALELALHVPPIRFWGAEEVDLHGMVDHEVGGHDWVDAVRITAHGLEAVPHGGQIDHGGNSGEVLENHAGRHERHVCARVRWAPCGHGLNVLGTDGAASGVAQGVLQKHADGEGEPAQIAEPGLLQPPEAVEGRKPFREIDGRQCAERVARHGGLCLPCLCGRSCSVRGEGT